MDAGDWRGVFTVVMFVLFIAICLWAWSSRRKDGFDEAAQLPLDEDPPGSVSEFYGERDNE
jgi:cytochrome c oxidase cbb3-type subunit 4